MVYSRKAFTMIELIFVIVILGILAAVAIPKLAATRTDAEVSKMAQNIMTSAAEISTYAMSKAVTDSDFTVMSNAMENMQKSGDANLSSNKAEIKAGTVLDCITVSVDVNDTEGTDTLNVIMGDANGDSQCLALQGAIDENKYPMKLRGTNVSY
jgi:prepilin-type N-terminal cleavage/methylation domain-containing protein